ncbi:hypothetical protein GCM10009678_19570 [Actinomadura kijaniata]|uniref:PH domain-containing protein n=1 Tax=Actinomadura namibiensis TaxID=182080 RepID=A0A7W3QR09_ACTNM|nr:hypothetical protein [Actinomadura namibiensis]MBA8956201.1 hypothetical protein [Actinomadura namibiensis]
MNGTSGALRLRPNGRSPLIVVPVLITGPALLLVGWTQPSATASLVGFGMTIYALRNLLILYQGRLEVWPDGLVNRLAGQRAEVTWERADRLLVIRTLFGRYAQLEERGGPRVSLAAPRTSLIMHTPRFDAVLNDLSRMPGGCRSPVPVHRTVPLPAITVQGILVLSVVGAVVVAVLR